MGGVTSMADKTIEEIIEDYTGLAPEPSKEEQARLSEITERELLGPLRRRRQELPDSVDLRELGRVSPVKNQQGCGSCVCFSAVTTIESCMARETGVLPTDLSEQHLMDCAFGYGTAGGCAGAWPMSYLQFMHEEHNGGLSNEEQYPYISGSWGLVERAGECRNASVPVANHGAVVTGHYQTWGATEEDIMRLLAEGHSMSTSLQVTGGYHLYRDGVYRDENCQNWREESYSQNRNHAVAIVGYGVLNGD